MGKDANHRGVAPLKTRFARLDHDLLRSAAYRSLSPNARSLLVEFAMMFNRSNNGALYLSVRDAAARMGVSDLKAASAALGELMDMGFIGMTAEGMFSSHTDRPSKARCWRITWEVAPGTAATFDYRHAIVRGKRPAQRAKEGRQALDRYASQKNRGEESTTATPFPVEDCTTEADNYTLGTPSIVEESTTAKLQKRPITVDAHRGGLHHTYSYTTTPAGSGPAETPSSDPVIAAGDFAVEFRQRALRRALTDYLRAAGYGGQKALSEATGIPAPVLSRFRGGGTLTERYVVPLRLELARWAQDREAA